MRQLRRKLAIGLLAAVCVSCSVGCYQMRGSWGGGQAPRFHGYRKVIASDIALPKGYKATAVAKKLNFPSAVAFDDQNRPYVVEAGYSYGEAFDTPRLVRIEDDGTLTQIAAGDNGPWTGATFYDGAFYIAEGGVKNGGAILRVAPDGTITRLVEGLPSVGDHHTNGPVVRDGFVYFAVGAATNSAVVGVDNADFGWLKRHPEFCDVPAKDIRLIGLNYESENPLTPKKGDKTWTGAFVPFGTRTQPGQIIKGRLPATAAIMRIPVGGGDIQLVAWGVRNPFGLAFSPAGDLYATENSFDTRGSRPIWGAGDVLWRIEAGRWYGWPDYHAGWPVDDDKRYKTPGENPPKIVIADPPGHVPQPAAVLAVHASASGLDFSKSADFGYVGNAFVAQFGDMAPTAGKVLGPVGFDVVRVDVATGVIEKFAVNKGDRNGPASKWRTGGLERPVNVRFDNTGSTMYIVDFGVLTVDEKGAKPWKNTGVLWRVDREVK